jgi:hypothetical protein
MKPIGKSCAGSGEFKIFGFAWNTVLGAFIVLTFFFLFNSLKQQNIAREKKLKEK